MEAEGDTRVFHQVDICAEEGEPERLGQSAYGDGATHSKSPSVQRGRRGTLGGVRGLGEAGARKGPC